MALREWSTSFLLLVFFVCCPTCQQSWPASPIDLRFPEPCPKTESQRTTENGYFRSGCTVRLRCHYSESECGNRTQASLVIFAQNSARNRTIQEVQRGACWVEVEIRNITWMGDREFFVCKDTADPRNISVKRSIRVGDPPVTPQNLTVEYFPLDSVRLWVNPVKTGRALNDNTTTWSVQYTWRTGPELCGRTDTMRLPSASGSFVACALNLTGLYQGHGTYRNLGNVYNPVLFNVSVSNLFGHSEPAMKSFSLPFNVRPGELGKPRVGLSGETWLMLNVDLPLGVDGPVLNRMSQSHGGQLRLQYTVHRVSEAEENRLRPERLAFYRKFGFYRNLQEDEEATAKLNLSASFPLSQEVLWQYSNQTVLSVNITGLSPNTHYNISLRPVARYPGPLLKMPVKEALTSETIPMQAPSLGISPSHCFHEEHCVTCVIYFQEIPRPLRLSEVTEYVLTASLARTAEGLPAGDTCDRRRNITLAADGQQNAILLPGLVADAVYSISLVADTAKGRSPASTCTFIARPSGVPTDVILEVRSSQGLGGPTEFRLSWRDAQLEPAADNVTYYVHFCYADTRISDVLCNTSLLTRPASTNTSSGILYVPYYHGNVTDLHPIFFVSAVHNGVSSGLIKAKWTYDMDKAPGKVQWVKVEASTDDTNSLDVYFGPGQESSVGNIPVYGRPDAYVIAWGESQKDECGSECEALSARASSQMTKLMPYVKLPLTLHGLSPRTYYCVGVRAVKGENGSDWTCSAGFTADDSPIPVAIASSVACVAAFLLFCGCLYFVHHCKRQIKIKEDQLKFSATDLPRPKTCTSQPQQVSAVSALTLATVQTIQQKRDMKVLANSLASSSEITSGGHFSQQEAQKCETTENTEEAAEEQTFYSKIHRQASEFCQDFGPRDGARGMVTEVACEEDGSSGEEEKEFPFLNRKDEENDVCEEVCTSPKRHLKESASERESDVNEASEDEWDCGQSQDDDEESDVSGEDCLDAGAAGLGRYVTCGPGSEDRSESSYESDGQGSCACDEDDDEGTDETRKGDGECEQDEGEMVEERRTGDASSSFLPSSVMDSESSVLPRPPSHFGMGLLQRFPAVVPMCLSTGADHSSNSDLRKATSRTACEHYGIKEINIRQETDVMPEGALPGAATNLVVPRHIIQLLERSASNPEHYVQF